MSEVVMDIRKIWETIPHRYPFLLVDRVTEITETGISGYKNVSANEDFFNGHFPEEPIMPGVLICEALAQLGAIRLKLLPQFEDKLMLFAGIDKLRFKKQVKPGDRLDLKGDIIKIKGRIGKAVVVATVDGQVACQAEIMFSAMGQ